MYVCFAKVPPGAPPPLSSLVCATLYRPINRVGALVVIRAMLLRIINCRLLLLLLNQRDLRDTAAATISKGSGGLGTGHWVMHPNPALA